MSETLVTNTSPLIFLSYVDGIDWLTRLSATSPLVAQAVIDEAEAGDGGKELTTAIRQNENFSIMPDIAISSEIATWDLGAGESQVLAYCLRDKNCRAVLDDKAARDCARSIDIPVIGSLGIVLIAKRQSWIPFARPVIEHMLTRNLYLAPSLIQAAQTLFVEPVPFLIGSRYLGVQLTQTTVDCCAKLMLSKLTTRIQAQRLNSCTGGLKI